MFWMGKGMTVVLKIICLAVPEMTYVIELTASFFNSVKGELVFSLNNMTARFCLVPVLKVCSVVKLNAWRWGGLQFLRSHPELFSCQTLCGLVACDLKWLWLSHAMALNGMRYVTTNFEWRNVSFGRLVLRVPHACRPPAACLPTMLLKFNDLTLLMSAEICPHHTAPFYKPQNSTNVFIWSILTGGNIMFIYWDVNELRGMEMKNLILIVCTRMQHLANIIYWFAPLISLHFQLINYFTLFITSSLSFYERVAFHKFGVSKIFLIVSEKKASHQFCIYLM